MQARAPISLPPITPTARIIVFVVLGSFIAELILQVWVGLPVFQTLALDATSFGISTFWQVFTYPLVERPDAIFKVLLSLLMLWWFLSPFEQQHGRRRLLQLCLVATLASAFAALGVGPLVLSTQWFAASYLAGSDPISLAALTAFAVTYRHSQILLFGIFPLKPMHIIGFSIGLSVLFFLASRDVVALAGHLAAIGSGFAFMNWLRRPPKQKKRRPLSGHEASLEVLQGGKSSDRPPRWLN